MRGQKRNVRRMTDAYFTVEAALVLPLMLWATVFLIYLMFLQYDRCLLEQDVFLYAMQGALPEGREQERYLSWQMQELTSDKGILTVNARGEGKVVVPFAGWNAETENGKWYVEAESEFVRVEPVKWLRTCRILEKQAEQEEVQE